ncbi:MAG: hypothetical protein E7514_02645 [Ruminococcaceae bacterium]|nr:hypothetical protein [Oscillospiraceae bacterium]
MNAEEKKAVIHRLEKRKRNFRFFTFFIYLLIKGRLDSKRQGAVDLEIRRYKARLKKFFEQEFRNLSKEIQPSIASIEQMQKADIGQDVRKQSRLNLKLKAETSFVDTATNVVIRLCLDAYEYTDRCVLKYLRYADASHPGIEEVTYDELYDNFINNFKEVTINYEEDAQASA